MSCRRASRGATASGASAPSAAGGLPTAAPRWPRASAPTPSSRRSWRPRRWSSSSAPATCRSPTSAPSSAPSGDEWWRYLAAPFAYPDVPYLFVCAVGIAIFGSAVERRLGMIATVVLMVACGGLGMLAADGIESALAGESNVLLAAGRQRGRARPARHLGDAEGGRAPRQPRRGRRGHRRRGLRGRADHAAAGRGLRQCLRRARGRPGRRRSAATPPRSRAASAAPSSARDRRQVHRADARAPPLRGRAQLLPRRRRARGRGRRRADGGPGADADRRRPGGADDDPCAGDRRPARARGGHVPRLRRDRDRARPARRRRAGRLRAGAGLRRPRPRAPGGRGARRPGRDPRRTGARDAAGPARLRALRLRLRRRRQAGLRRLLRAVPAAAAPRRAAAAGQRLHGRPHPRPRGRRRGDRGGARAQRPHRQRTSASTRRCWRSPTASPWPASARSPGHERAGDARGVARPGQGGDAALLAAARRGLGRLGPRARRRAGRGRPQGARSLGFQLRLLRGRRAAARVRSKRLRRPTTVRASGPGPSGCPRTTPRRRQGWSGRDTPSTATPRYMGMPLAELRQPAAGDDLEFREREDYAELARINEIAYGYPPGDFAALAEAPMPGIRIYFAALERRGGLHAWDLAARLRRGRDLGRHAARGTRARDRRSAAGARASATLARTASRPRRCSRQSSAARSTSGSATATTARSQMWERRRT